MITWQAFYVKVNLSVGNKRTKIQSSWIFSAVWGWRCMYQQRFLVPWKRLHASCMEKRKSNTLTRQGTPPCSSSLRKHVTRANYVARLWRMAQYPIMALEDPQFHGWLSSLNIDWISEAYPDDVAKLVVERDEGSDKESDAPEDSSYSCSSDDDE